MDGPGPTQGDNTAAVRRRQVALFAGTLIVAAGAGFGIGSATGSTPAHASQTHLADTTTVKMVAATIVTVNDAPKVPALRPVQTHPTHTAPATHPAYTAPAQPAYTAPTHPAYTAPAQPAYTAPAQPAYTAPAKPAYTAPAQPAYTAPAQPAHTAPAQPAHTSPTIIHNG